jgi:hypothetical protein
MPTHGVHKNGELGRPILPRQADKRDWKPIFTDAVLTARAQGIAGFSAGARKGIPFGMVLGFAVATLGVCARGKNGYWNDVIIQGAYSFLLLGFAGVILTSIIGALMGGFFGACRGAYGIIQK